MARTQRTATSRRYLFIDGLRGVAALMVVVYHFYEGLAESMAGWFPPLLGSLAARGNLGVDVFFVLSGFVIIHSVQGGKFTATYLGRFVLRRSIRLDPPLWLTIAGEIVLVVVSGALFSDLLTDLPSVTQVITNLTYTQELLRTGNVVPVFWSLTYEIQFYVVLVLLFIVQRRLAGRLSGPGLNWVTWVGLSSMIVYSTLIYHQLLPTPLRGLFIERWFQFSLGMLAWMVVKGRLDLRVFAVAGAAIAISAVVAAETEYRVLSSLSAVIVATALVWAGLTGRMFTLLAGRVIQFLGRISYSLYLLHLPLGWRAVSAVKRFLGPELSPLEAAIAWSVGVAVAIAGSWLMYALIEAPSMKLARRVKLPKAAT